MATRRAPSTGLDRLTALARSAGPEDTVTRALEEALAGAVSEPPEVRLVPDGSGDADGRHFVLAGESGAEGGDGADDAVVAGLLAAGSAAISARRAWQAAGTDALTGVANRSTLDAHLEQELARARRHDSAFACAMLDVDDFKAYNDARGHLAGDAVLRALAAGLQGIVRPFDLVARYGGDELAVVLQGVELDALPAAAERLAAAATRAIAPLSGLGCRIGLAVADPSMTPEDLLREADAALREAKATDRTRWRIAPARGATAPEEEGSPRARAMDVVLRGGSSVRFQPIVTLNGGERLVGFEALGRGAEPLGSPVALLEHARAVGRLIDIDEALHRQAFRVAGEHGLRAPLSLFVNIEPETLARLDGDDRLWRRTTTTFASVSEITERALLARPGALLRACVRLRELGWGIAVDDVGTDPRTLALLPLIAPDVIKLDLRATQDAVSEELADLTMSASAQRHHGRARLLAEGVETPEHLQRARALGADYAQGHLTGRPTEELTLGPRKVSALPRALPPSFVRGVTPFQLIAAERPVRAGDTALVASLHEMLEQRAAVLGPRAALITAVSSAEEARHVVPRLVHLADRVGVVALIGPLGEVDPGELHHADVEREDSLAEEWTTVLLCTEQAAVLTARRERPSGPWQFALEHDREIALAVGHALVRRLP